MNYFTLKYVTNDGDDDGGGGGGGDHDDHDHDDHGDLVKPLINYLINQLYSC